MGQQGWVGGWWGPELGVRGPSWMYLCHNILRFSVCSLLYVTPQQSCLKGKSLVDSLKVQ